MWQWQFMIEAWGAYRRMRRSGNAQFVTMVDEAGAVELVFVMGEGHAAWDITRLAEQLGTLISEVK